MTTTKTCPTTTTNNNDTNQSKKKPNKLPRKNSSTVTACVIGDKGVGKSQLLWRLSKNKFGENCTEPSYKTGVNVFGRTTILETYDWPGDKDAEEKRALSYKVADVIILCASVDSLKSLTSLPDIWMKELRKYKCHNLPRILVITKSDLKDEANKNNNKDKNKNNNNKAKDDEDDEDEDEDENGAIIDIDDVIEMAHKLKVSHLSYCSAKTGQDVLYLFRRATELGLQRQEEKRNKICCLCRS